MDPHALRLLSRIAAIEFLIENVYAVALLQTTDPVGEAYRWAGEVRNLANQMAAAVSAEADDDNPAATVVAGMTSELDSIFARIVQRIEARARDHPVAGSA